MNISGDVLAPKRTLDVGPVPQCDGRDGRSEDGERDTVREREVGGEEDGLDLGEAGLIEREVRVEDLAYV